MKTQPAPSSSLSVSAIERALGIIRPGIRRTACDLSPRLSAMTGRRIWLKREDLQRTGSFKERGARHALLRLAPERRACGVIAASAGNHALGLAYHGSQLNTRVTVVMPVGAPDVKVSRCEGLGARVILHGASYDEAQAHALDLAEGSGAAFVHPFDDLDVIAGQGTLALELLEQAPGIDTVVVPVGGGGLLAGVATAIKASRPDVRVIGVEPDGGACFGAAVAHGAPTRIVTQPTLADGLAVGCAGPSAYAIAAPLVDELVTVTEEAIAQAIALLARQCGITVEGAGAVGLAALLTGGVASASVALLLTGRNISPRRHSEVVGRYADAAAWLAAG